MAATSAAGMEHRSSPQSALPTKFPRLSSDEFRPGMSHDGTRGRSTSPGPNISATGHGALPNHRWQPRKDNSVHWGNGSLTGSGVRHGRQKSLSDAIETIRNRRGSVSANAQELAEALKAPVSPKLVFLCGLWYATSILSNTSSKSILIAFPKPITLTLVQFAFVSSWCILCAWLARKYPALRTMLPVLKHEIRPPSRELILTTLPLTAFQVGGHILSSDAMSRIPVSLVHTIKGLSPLLTVLAYRLFFHIHYSIAVYLSLIPLTLGVIMACSANFSGNFIGLLLAFGSALLFVTQNIVSKKLFNEAARAESDPIPQKNRKPDKLNLLCYSSGLAFLFTLPLWLWSEGFGIIADFLQDASVELSDRPGALDHGGLSLEFVFNGTFHFGQNLVAFVLLSMVSPVTYSVASLIKRVFVILFAIVWFGNKMTAIQAVGIALTFLGLYLYDRTSDAAKAERVANRLQAKPSDALLPVVSEKRSDEPVFSESPLTTSSPDPYSGANGSAARGRLDDVKLGSAGPGRPRESSGSGGWRPPGTKQEETWIARDMARQQGVSVS